MRNLLLTAAVAASLALPAFAEGMIVSGPFARSASPVAKSGAAFMEITNDTGQDDRLIAAASDAAPKVELHTHIAEGGVMKMRHVEDGFPIAAGETLKLERGSHHVMFMGLPKGFADGETVTVTLTFEKAGDITVEIPVDLAR